MTYFYKKINSPLGKLTLVAADQALVAILWQQDVFVRVRFENLTEDNTYPLLLEAEKQLNEYFEGRLQTFSLKLNFIGTEFQKKVWHALLTIPFGETRSYGQIAEQIGHPKASRAVGAASGKNPISIVAPCHRVIGSNGKLTGFAGGLDAKAYLLNLENNCIQY